MELTVYVDVLFVLNGIIDAMLLIFCALALSLRISPLRLTFSACLGAFYAACVPFFPMLGAWWGLLFVSALMIWWCFRATRPFIFLQQMCVFYLIAFLLSGLCTFSSQLFFANSNRQALWIGSTPFFTLPAIYLLFLLGVVYILLRIAFFAARKTAEKKSLLAPVRIAYNKQVIRLSALYDTGNFLCDRFGSGVCIAAWSAIAPLFPDCPSRDVAVFSADKIRFFACNSIGGNDTLPAFWMQIADPKGRWAISRWVAVTNKELDQNGRYALLLPNDFEGAK